MTRAEIPNGPVVAAETNEMVRTARPSHRFIEKVNEKRHVRCADFLARSAGPVRPFANPRPAEIRDTAGVRKISDQLETLLTKESPTPHKPYSCPDAPGRQHRTLGGI